MSTSVRHGNGANLSRSGTSSSANPGSQSCDLCHVICVFQAAGEDQHPEGGHREAAQAAGAEEAPRGHPDAPAQPRAEQTQEQEQRPGERSVSTL